MGCFLCPARRLRPSSACCLFAEIAVDAALDVRVGAFLSVPGSRLYLVGILLLAIDASEPVDLVAVFCLRSSFLV